MIRSVLKRDGRVVLYDEEKIVQAIFKCLKVTGEGDFSTAQKVAKSVEMALDLESNKQSPPPIEHIQDAVEHQLMQFGLEQSAKAYILYRANRTRIRETNTSLMRTIDEITNVDARQSDMKRDNANIDGNTAMGSMLQIGTAGAKAYNEAYLLTPEQAKAHREGDIHIHDFDFYSLTTTCSQIDIIKLFEGGFSTGHGFLREPQSIQSYAALAAIAIQSNQNDQHGGQSIPNFDYGMAKGVEKSFAKTYLQKCTESLEDLLGKENLLETVRTFIQQASDNTQTSPRLQKDETIFDSQLANLLAQDYQLDSSVVTRLLQKVRKRATAQTERDTYQAMEGFVHNLNTMHSRAGAQTPFSSINYGTDTTPEGRMVIRNILLATDAGLGHGETCIFPIHIFKVKEGVNYNPQDPNYDLFKLSMKVNAKRLFPNYVFLDSPFNLQYYKPGQPETEVATMGCRTRVMGNIFDPEREISFGRGNLSFTSINLPRLALESKGNETTFYQLLDQMLDLTANQLLDRFAIQSKKCVYNYPFLMGQGVWLDSDKLGINDTVGEVLKHGTLSIGFIGLAETLTALYGYHHGQNEEMQKKGLEIISYMRNYCDKKSQKTKMNFSLLATPAEGLAGRFIRMDKNRYGEIEGVTDKEYYTNSFHIPVSFAISAFDKIRLEAPYHALTNAGHISYVELDGDTSNNIEAFESIVRCMHDAQIGYGSINHPVDRDPVCGYVGVIGDVCPRCGRKEGEAISQEKLKELRRQYPGIPTFCGCE